MNAINHICRILLGALFIFSGFVKSVDPMGTTYKIVDYFKAGGAPIPENMAIALAVALCAAELIIGLSLFLNIKVKLISWFSLIFMAGFTIITLILAITNKVADCGCFGDAFKLTNWQTFYKNLIILPFAVVVFWQRKHYRESIAPFAVWTTFLLIIAFSILFNLYNIKHLPLVNYRPYKVGQNIWRGMQLPPNAPADQYDIKLIYQKDGIKKEFNEQNYPWQDTSWVFVEQKSTLIKKGYTPPIHDFSILSEKDGDITEKILKKKGETYLFIASSLEKTNIDNILKANAIYEVCQQYGVPFIMLTSSTGKAVKEFREATGAKYPIYASDETSLKTAMRSNPGLMMLYDGTIAGLWSGYDLPEPHFFKGNTLGKQLDAMTYYQDQRNISLLIGAVLLIGCLLLLMRWR